MTGNADKVSSGPFAWRVYASEGIATLFLLVISIASLYFTPPAALTFTERDPTMSYQLTIPETVPVSMLFGISLAIPFAVILLGHIIQAIKHRLTGETPAQSVLKSFAWVLLCFVQCLCIVFAVTGCIKTAVGRHRPNFFALCNYQGYDDALKSGNFSQYDALTTAGRFGSLDNCWADIGSIWEGQKSFPSGHASISFAGMTFTTLYLRALFSVPHNVHVTIPAVVAASPLVLSSWVAISRVRDRWHNPDDISVGTLIGILSALVAWWHYRAHRRAGNAPSGGAATLGESLVKQQIPLLGTIPTDEQVKVVV